MKHFITFVWILILIYVKTFVAKIHPLSLVHEYNNI